MYIIYIDRYIHTYIYIYISVCACACRYRHRYKYKYRYRQIIDYRLQIIDYRLQIQIQIQIQIYIHKRIYVYYLYIYVCIHTHICIYIYINRDEPGASSASVHSKPVLQRDGVVQLQFPDRSKPREQEDVFAHAAILALASAMESSECTDRNGMSLF